MQTIVSLQINSFCLIKCAMFDKIKNPKAKPANIILAIVYVAVLSTAFAFAVAHQIQCGGGAITEKINF